MSVGFFVDAACTLNCTSIAFGNLNPGESKPYVVYVKNPRNVPVVLTLAVGNWMPTSASTVLSLNWDLDDYVLQVGSSTPATFVLAAAPNTGNLGDFSFNIIVTGTQVETRADLAGANISAIN